MDKGRSKNNSVQNEKIAKLVRELKDGNKESFQTLYDYTWKSVFYMLTKKIGNEDDALIVLNEVYLKVYSGIHKIENENSFMKWLNTIACLRCADFLREKYLKSRRLQTQNSSP